MSFGLTCEGSLECDMFNAPVVNEASNGLVMDGDDCERSPKQPSTQGQCCY